MFCVDLLNEAPSDFLPNSFISENIQ